MKDFLEFANILADEAGKISRKYFRKKFSSSQKSDKSIVTIADLEIEKKLTGLIKKHFPQHDIFGEEYGKILGKENKDDYKWVIDPIDGTSSFSTGRPSFTNLIALLKNNKPILGVINQPISRERWIAAGKTSLLNGKKIKTSNKKNLGECVIATTSPDIFNSKQVKKFEDINKRCKATVYGGDAYLYGLLAAGHIDIVLEANLKLYDYAATSLVIENAGGYFRNWGGGRPSFAREENIIACGNKKILEEILKVI